MNFLVHPKSVIKTKGTFKAAGKLYAVSVFPADKLPLDQLKADLKTKDIMCSVKKEDKNAAIEIYRDRFIGHRDGYQLNISPDKIRIKAGHDAGAYYAIQTLREIFRMNGKVIPCMRIEDQPDFSRRGVYLDCSRGKVPKITSLCEMIELFSTWKLNEVQIYVENVFTFKKHPTIGNGFDPFTPEDIITLKDCCRKFHINFVPSIATLGHMEKILMLKEYQHLAELPGTRGLKAGTTISPADPESAALVNDMLEEYIPLFDSPEINICGDEPWELGEGRTKAKAARVGKGQVYLDFMNKVRAVCLKHNRRVNMWSDVLLNHPEMIEKTPKDTVILNWQYHNTNPKDRMSRTHLFADAGLPLVVCPGTNGWRSHGTRLHMSISNVSAFAAIGLENNAEGILNTDWGDSGHRNTHAVSLHSFAHGAAHGWNTRAVSDDTFTETFTAQVLGDKKGAFAGFIRLLGSNEKLSMAANSILVESLIEDKLLEHFWAQGQLKMSAVLNADAAEIKKHLSALKQLSVPALSADALPLMKKMYPEFEIARLMEITAFERMLIARAYRAGHKLKSTDLIAHAQQMRSMAIHFKKIWLTRNRPSKLEKNIRAFKLAEQECRQIAKTL